MPLHTCAETDRDAAVAMVCQLIASAAIDRDTTATVRLIAWMDARDENEGGFLWLAGVLGYQPSALVAMIRSTLDAPPRRRQAIERKLLKVGCGEAR